MGRCRRYIPRSDGGRRPLAVAALKDKIVHRAKVAVLTAIYFGIPALTLAAATVPGVRPSLRARNRKKPGK